MAEFVTAFVPVKPHPGTCQLWNADEFPRPFRRHDAIPFPAGEQHARSLPPIAQVRNSGLALARRGISHAEELCVEEAASGLIPALRLADSAPARSSMLAKKLHNTMVTE